MHHGLLKFAARFARHLAVPENLANLQHILNLGTAQSPEVFQSNDVTNLETNECSFIHFTEAFWQLAI
jgi:hypothetical protein